MSSSIIVPFSHVLVLLASHCIVRLPEILGTRPRMTTMVACCCCHRPSLFQPSSARFLTSNLCRSRACPKNLKQQKDLACHHSLPLDSSWIPAFARMKLDSFPLFVTCHEAKRGHSLKKSVQRLILSNNLGF